MNLIIRRGCELFSYACRKSMKVTTPLALGQQCHICTRWQNPYNPVRVWWWGLNPMPICGDPHCNTALGADVIGITVTLSSGESIGTILLCAIFFFFCCCYELRQMIMLTWWRRSAWCRSKESHIIQCLPCSYACIWKSERQRSGQRHTHTTHHKHWVPTPYICSVM